MRTEDFTYFVLLNPNQASYSFDTYTTREGEIAYHRIKTDSRGNDIKRRFKFSKARRMLSIPNTQQDVIIFLKNHPLCVDSPNNVGQQYLFKELNDGKDAVIAIEATANKTKALNLALSLEGKDLVDAAAACGYLHKDPSILKHHLLQFAENDPVAFIQICSAPDRKARALAEIAIARGVVTRKGFMFMFNETHIGNNIEQVVKKLMDDSKLFKYLEDEVERKS